jgi:hypothetical protein
MAKKIKPLEAFDFRVVQQPLTGLIRNMDTDLKRRVDLVGTTNDRYEIRRHILFLIALRFAANSYKAVGFLLAEEEHSRRLKEFIFVVPPINRQMMDLWASLVYIMDDFGPRALAFEECAYREMREEVDKRRVKDGNDGRWDDWFEDMRDLLAMLEAQVPITAEQKADLSKIDYWLTPFKLSKIPGKSQKFLQFLNDLMYHDTSAESHLKPGGLLGLGSFFILDLAPEEIRRQAEDRNIHQVKFRHFCRTVLILLGIFSEIETYCKLNNNEQLVRIWTLLGSVNSDTKDIYEMRYRAMLT